MKNAVRRRYPGRPGWVGGFIRSAGAHRRGQREPVTAYRLFSRETVVDLMIDRSRWKRELVNETIDADTSEISAIEVTGSQGEDAPMLAELWTGSR